MVKEEEEGGFHGNRLVSRETQGEMSVQSQGCSRERTGSPGSCGVAPRDRGPPSCPHVTHSVTSPPNIHPSPCTGAHPKPRRL